MATYKTYQEAKIANPSKDIYEHENKFMDYDCGHFDRTLYDGKWWHICNPADYCMSVYDFLKSGKEFVEGDAYLSKDGDKVVEVSRAHVSSANHICGSDKKRFVLRAKALEENQEYTSVTKPFFELQKEFEAGELYMKAEPCGTLVNVLDIATAAIAHSNGGLYYKAKPDWRDEAVKEFGSCKSLRDMLLIGMYGFAKEEAESLAKAILAGIEKAK